MGNNGNGSNGSHKLLTTDLPGGDALNEQQRAFVATYLETWNATEAARVAGYAFPRQAGSRLLTYVDIQAAIDEELRAYGVGRSLVLSRLSEQANLNLKDFIDDDGVPVVEKIKRKGYLVKKYKCRRNHKLSTEEYDVDDIELELVDSQAALFFLGRHNKLIDADGGNTFVIIQDLIPLLRLCMDPAKAHILSAGLESLAAKHGVKRVLPAMAEVGDRGSGGHAEAKIVSETTETL